ncbi:MAG: TIGR02452 family protein [Spirochaetaceae bacterium]|jgi:uncharacterized protein (TIGR02452 family)|nr:TIGR02452 family protein [Spirochaetaceae bacterium]
MYQEQTFDSRLWLKKFKDPSRDRNRCRELRVSLFQETVGIVNDGGYRLNGEDIPIRNDSVPAQTEYFTGPPKLPNSPGNRKTNYAVIQADCLETAEVLLQDGYNPCVLNMTSGHNPGGGVRTGAGAQEETIFRRTNLFKSLYQFADYAAEYGTARSSKSYPLDKNRGGVYSGGITVFRASENNGYALLKKPFQVSFVSVPALRRPELENRGGKYFITKRLVESAKEKIRTILRIAGKYAHDSIVLGAFGCGAYANPPHHIASLFKEVFAEQEFKDYFRTLVFSIIDDHNSRKEHNPDGNILPFLNVFNASS